MSRNKLQLPALSDIQDIYRQCAARDKAADIDTTWERVGAFWGVTGKKRTGVVFPRQAEGAALA